MFCNQYNIQFHFKYSFNNSVAENENKQMDTDPFDL